LTLFLQNVPLGLTPLTPIHIGCGEDFEPTNYVIDAGALYHFEPARVALSESERGELVRSVNRPGNEAFRAVQYFFHQRRAACRTASHLRVAVASGVAEEYETRIGRVAQHERGGRAVINRLVIERTAHHPHSGRPYIPGSSLKGSMRTAWLSSEAPTDAAGCDRERGSSKKAVELEKEILDGSFFTDPFRLLGVADAAGGELSSRIVFAVNRSKRQSRGSTQSISRTDLSVRCEVINGGQLRGLKGEIRFMRPGEFADGRVPALEKRIADFTALTKACNAFYTLRLRAEMNLLHRLVSLDWTQRFESLIASLQPLFDDGRAMLLRIGRHSGAESVTLDRWRCIQIRAGRNRSHWASEATTIWLAAESEDGVSGMLPFGWILIERADTPVPDALMRWCDEELKRPSTDISQSARAPVGKSRGSGPAKPADAESAQYRFRKGDRVTNGEEQATVERDVRPVDTRMDVRFDDGEIEGVPVAAWRRVL
jgi:CRISPR-associated protein Csm5